MDLKPSLEDKRNPKLDSGEDYHQVEGSYRRGKGSQVRCCSKPMIKVVMRKMKCWK